MKIQKFALALFSLVFLFENSLANELSQKTSNRISMEDAINLAEEAKILLDEESPLKSRLNRAVNSVSALVFGDVKASAMKSGKYKDLGVSDTLAYVFNFGDSSGYVIISNDKRVENPLFAFTKKGSLVNGKTDNPGLALFLERLEGYVLESIAKSEKGDEKKEVMAVAQKGPVNPASLSIRILVNPLVPVEWDQDDPFNNNLEHRGCSPWPSNGKVPTGCAATAAAQIMSYWKYPTSIIDGTIYDWTVLNNRKHSDDFYPPNTPYNAFSNAYARAMVADLFQRIGTGVKMKYDCKVSLAYLDTTLIFLVSKGFTLYGNTYLRDYSLALVQTALESRIPLMAIGCNNGNTNDCHIWVIDGLARKKILSLPIGDYYLNNNWGWNGRDNGFFLSGVFDPNVFNFKNIRIGSVYR
jgi:hypothetical protein